MSIAGSRIIRVSAFALIALLAGCAPKPLPKVRIGLLALISSDFAVQSGVPSQQGAQMAVDDINALGGVDIAGRKLQVKLTVRDYEPRPDAAAIGARALINLDSVDAIVGPQMSVYAVTAASVAEDSHVPMIAPMASNPAVTLGRHYVFRLAFLDPFQGEMLARYAAENLHARRAAVLYDVGNAYGRDITALFRATFEQAGGKMVAAETFTSDQSTDFRPQLRRILAANPDVLLLPNYSAVDSFQVRQARAIGIRAPFLGSDTWDPVGLGHIPEAEGTVVAHQWHIGVPRPQSVDFVSRYRARFGVEPRTTAVFTYDAIRLVADAMHRAGTTDGEAVSRALASTKGFEAVAGTLQFNGTGDPRRGGVLSRIGRNTDSIIRVVDPKP
jgi:branched-chain amino acid transport system substrate-binding protein